MGFIHNWNRNSRGKTPGSNDRRRTCRYTVFFEDALLGWWDGPNFVEVPARFLDLSLQGCMLELPRAPARTARQDAWVRSLATAADEWAKGVVLSVRKPLMKRCRVSVAFCDPFPYQSFKKLVCGNEDLRATIRDVVALHEQDHYWK
jgi:hypothetical protein